MSEWKKSTDIEIAQRVEKIYYKLLNNYTRQEILRYCSSETDWNVSERQIDEYMARATKIIKDASKETYAEWLEKSKQQLAYLYKIACEDGNITEARQIKMAENKILGYERLNIEHSGEIKAVDILSVFQDLKDQLNGEVKPETADDTKKDS